MSYSHLSRCELVAYKERILDVYKEDNILAQKLDDATETWDDLLSQFNF